MQSVLSGEEFKHYFGEDPSQERVGDMVEALLAMFEVAQQLPGAFPGWGDIEVLRTGLEESIKRVTASFIDMTTYDNRKRARVRYLDPNSAEASSLNLIVYKIRGTGRPTHTIDYRFEMGLAMGEHVETPPPSEEEQGAVEQDADMEAEPEAIDVETEPDQEMGTEVALSAEQEQLLKMIDEVERQFGSISLCIHCSSGGHSTMDCIQQLPPSTSTVTSILHDWRSRIVAEDSATLQPEEEEPAEEPSRKKRRQSPKPTQQVDEEFRRREMLKARIVTWYADEGRVMVWIADEVEGGEKTIFGRYLNTTGLSSSMDLIDLVERAFSQSGAYEPTPCRNFFPLPEKNQAGYKPINPKTMIGTVEMVPVNGCAFASHDYDYGTKMYPSKHTRVESYPHGHRELSKSLGTKLRHRIGRQWKSGRMGPVKCDDGAWVDWEDIVTDNYIWHDGHWDDRSIPIGVRKARLEIFFTQNFECFRTSKRTRFQMLAVRIDPQIHNRSDDPAISMFIPELLQKGCTKARLEYTEKGGHTQWQFARHLLIRQMVEDTMWSLIPTKLGPV